MHWPPVRNCRIISISMQTANSIAGVYKPGNGDAFQAINPATGEMLEGIFHRAGKSAVDEAMQAAAAAAVIYSQIAKDQKALFLRTIATEIEAVGSLAVKRASEESGLPHARLTGEIGRTTGQLRMFADLVEEGSWVQAVIDTAQPNRHPMPKPDIRRMLVAMGPVVVFGASNFPLAFSVAGGDTASALAAGCPVIVKAHPAHPGTSALIAAAINAAAQQCNMPPGVFSLLYDDGYDTGALLVKHPVTKAVAFTGSYKGGMALLQLAAERNVPIPVFAEMGSINPVLLLPAALEKRSGELATSLAASITQGGGQFCTKPGLLLAMQSPGLEAFITTLAAGIRQTLPVPMLTEGICHQYQHHSAGKLAAQGVELLAEAGEAAAPIKYPTRPRLAKVSAQTFLRSPDLQEEVFGPYAMLVVAENMEELQAVTAVLSGQLTVTIMAEREELSLHAPLIRQISQLAGRIVYNGVPTGVEVCAAMQHGGPFPASTDSRFTSVGTAAIYRFTRPMAWQNCADEWLPGELQSGNPLNILRTTDLTTARL